MNRCHHHIASFQKVFGIIELAVGFDIHLSSRKNGEVDPLLLEVLVDGSNGLDLRIQLLRVKAPGDANGRRMIAEGNVLVAQSYSGVGHLQDRSPAVRPVAVNMQIAPNVLWLQKLGQRSPQGGLYLTPVLSHLRSDVGQTQSGVDILLLIVEKIPAVCQAGE